MSRRDTNKDFRGLALKLLAVIARHGRAGHCFRILVLSAHPHEGKTTVASALAINLAALTDRGVVLVDANCDAPRLHRLFRGVRGQGFAEMLAAESGSNRPPPAAHVARNLWVVGAGAAPMPKLLFRSSAIDRAMSQIDKQWEVAVFDGAAASGSGRNALVSAVDRVLMVVDSSHTTREVVDSALETLGLREGDRLAGIVLNRRREYIPKMIYGWT